MKWHFGDHWLFSQQSEARASRLLVLFLPQANAQARLGTLSEEILDVKPATDGQPAVGERLINGETGEAGKQPRICRLPGRRGVGSHPGPPIPIDHTHNITHPPPASRLGRTCLRQALIKQAAKRLGV